ncbi:glycosyltransferase domain-containing protein [Xanthobacter sp. KR7-65]|uniref:glycosyltransferase domain-containing protein n=1 Tax=Xanthobacter sp. KR7-65 TaxID=3156612 RepID=UPI0032B564F1
MARACVYTCLAGGYEALNEQPVAAQSNLDFLCFTDDPSLASQSWRIMPMELALPLDPVRSQRIVKLSPHELLPGYDVSLYIDNAVILTAPPEEIIARHLPSSARAAVPGHSFRASIKDEFLEILRLGFDDAGRILEQLNHYQLTAPEVLADVPFWSAVMIRRHHDPVVIAAMRTWLTQVLRYSRRDQVSGTYAFRRAGLTPERIEIDNAVSWFHRWPVAPERDRSALPFAPVLAQLPAALLVEEWMQARRAGESRIAALEHALRQAEADLEHLRAAEHARAIAGDSPPAPEPDSEMAARPPDEPNAGGVHLGADAAAPRRASALKRLARAFGKGRRHS